MYVNVCYCRYELAMPDEELMQAKDLRNFQCQTGLMKAKDLRKLTWLRE